MGAWGTKVQTTTLSALEGNIINSLDPVVGVDPTKNAPSINVVNTALGTLDTAVDTINDNLTVQDYTATSATTLATTIDEYIAQTNMQDGETRRLHIVYDSNSSWSVEITRVGSDYNGVAFRLTDATSRYSFLKIGGASTVANPFKKEPSYETISTTLARNQSSTTITASNFTKVYAATMTSASNWQGMHVSGISISGNNEIIIYNDASTVSNYGTITVTLSVCGEK